MKKFFFAVLICIAAAYSAHAQNLRWSLRPIFGLNGSPWAAIGTVGNAVTLFTDYDECYDAETKNAMRFFSLVIPQCNSNFQILKLEQGGEKVDVRYFSSFGNFLIEGFRNHTLGYEALLIPTRFPLGVNLSFMYDRHNYRLKFPDDDDYIRYRRNILRPEALLQIRIGSYFSKYHKINFIMEVGAAYNHIIRCRGKYNDLNSVEDGVTLIGGMGWLNTISGKKLTIRYRHDNFDYFNKNFTPDGKTYPYKDLKSYRGVVELAANFAF